MVECIRTQVNGWLERGLEEYYPVVFVDCVHIKIHRSKSVATEAFYVVLPATGDGTREVLGIFNMPQESATGWGDIFDTRIVGRYSSESPFPRPGAVQNHKIFSV